MTIALLLPPGLALISFCDNLAEQMLVQLLLLYLQRRFSFTARPLSPLLV